MLVESAPRHRAGTTSTAAAVPVDLSRYENHMSFVPTQPDALAVSAGKLQSLRSAMNAGNAAAAAPTTGVVRAAGDEVSALTATQFAGHAEIYQAMSAQAAAIHQQFVDVLAVSAASYAATEAANTVAAR